LVHEQRGSRGTNALLRWKNRLQANRNHRDLHEKDVLAPVGPRKEGRSDRERRGPHVCRQRCVPTTSAKGRAPSGGYQSVDACGCYHYSFGSPFSDPTLLEVCAEELQDTSKLSYASFKFVGAVRSDASWSEMNAKRSLDDFPSRSMINRLDLARTRRWLKGQGS